MSRSLLVFDFTHSGTCPPSFGAVFALSLHTPWSKPENAKNSMFDATYVECHIIVFVGPIPLRHQTSQVVFNHSLGCHSAAGMSAGRVRVAHSDGDGDPS